MVRNVHRRLLPLPLDAVGSLLDGLASSHDRLWPVDEWPAMRFDRALGVGARGGHGPIRYHVEAYEPGRRVRFRFEAPVGFDGYHEYVVASRREGSTTLGHALVMRTRGTARLLWPLLYRPLHDALIEDSLDNASRSLALEVVRPQCWSWRVRALRAVLKRLQRPRP